MYITPTTSSTPGNPRGTVEEVYARINKDIERGISLLKDAKNKGSHKYINLILTIM
ncbi:RagB/SusD family nutrient uptake outer membrane protein [Bacteroides salyersiae]|nr:RagB/SusD family nutrient uptake outer membrane protein [Bacteroides salyersiae]